MPGGGDAHSGPRGWCDRRPGGVIFSKVVSEVGCRRNGVATGRWHNRSRSGRIGSGLAVIPVAAARYGRDPLPAKTRDAIGMQLRIVDRPAFLLHTIGTEAAVRVHHRLITLAVAYVLLR